MATSGSGDRGGVKRHTDREFEAELRSLRDQLLLMAGRVEGMISDAVRALEDGDAALARSTIRVDREVNRAEIDTDELCLLILAKRQPLGSDLRFITLALKMVTDLERIGDLAVNICERAVDLAREPRLGPYDDIRRAAALAQSMVHDAIDAFVERDAAKAQVVIERDDEVDEAYHQIFRSLLRTMTQDATAVERGIHIQSVAKFLERIGDHCTNIAEQVVFMVKGTDIRHAGKL
ncbi:MAG: phosphate transport system regulatory protein PhoU [Myxococcales bacterium]